MALVRATRFRDVVMTHGAVAALLVLAMQSGSEEPGLSKGLDDPADLGTRCSVLAGRDDRAYLDCGKQAPPASTSSIAPPDGLRSDQVGVGREGSGRRYRLRNR
jgi:hypothetical protein